MSNKGTKCKPWHNNKGKTYLHYYMESKGLEDTPKNRARCKKELQMYRSGCWK